MLFVLADVVAVSNLLIATLLFLVTGVYTVVTWLLWRSATDPHVIVYTRDDESRPSMIQIVIENIGRGVAHDVRFELSHPIPHRAFGMPGTPPRAPEQAQMSGGPLINGIPSLAPGQRRKITWGQYGGLKNAIGERQIRVTCRYSGSVPWRLRTKSILEIRSYDHTDEVDSDGARQCAGHLEEISRVMQGAASGFMPLVVKTLQSDWRGAPPVLPDKGNGKGESSQ